MKLHHCSCGTSLACHTWSFNTASVSAGCEYAAVERVNKEAVLPLLRELVRTPFFRYFKVNLYCDCPFWPDDGMCMLRDCGVCECEPDEVPAPWKDADTAASCEGASYLHLKFESLLVQQSTRYVKVPTRAWSSASPATSKRSSTQRQAWRIHKNAAPPILLSCTIACSVSGTLAVFTSVHDNTWPDLLQSCLRARRVMCAPCEA